MMKSVDDLTQEIIVEFNSYRTVDEKYAHLFQLGDQLPLMDQTLKNEANKVQGCQSNLWFHLSAENGRFHLQADSDSRVIKGIAALLVRVVENSRPAEIQQLSLDFIDQLQIWKLASERNNGLLSMLAHIRQQAREIDPDSDHPGEEH